MAAILARYLYFLGRDVTGVILKLSRGRNEISIPEFYVRTVA